MKSQKRTTTSIHNEDIFRPVDLHVHIRGTIPPEEIPLLPIPSVKDDKLAIPKWDSFDSFLQAYDCAGKLVNSPETLEITTYNYLEHCASMNVPYVELMISPGHSIQNGISYQKQVSSIENAIVRAMDETGLVARIMVTCVRHHGPSEAIKIAELINTHPSPYVVGFGLTGNELKYSPKDFVKAFELARECRGIGLTAHTGEWLDAKSVIETVDTLSLSRVGHGIRAVEDSGVLREMNERMIGFEICLSSNLALNATSDLSSHPLHKLIASGSRFALCTDDPSFFNTSPRKEYQIAEEHFGLDHNALMQVSRNAIAMSFCDPETKNTLIENLENANS